MVTISVRSLFDQTYGVTQPDCRGPVLLAQLPLRAPELLARLRVERGHELLLLVVVHDHQRDRVQRGRAAGAEVEVDGIRLERRLPDLLAVEVVRVEAEVAGVDVDLPRPSPASRTRSCSCGGVRRAGARCRSRVSR